MGVEICGGNKRTYGGICTVKKEGGFRGDVYDLCLGGEKRGCKRICARSGG